jgi:hypothetical protein
MSIHALVSEFTRPRARSRTRALGGLLLAVLITGVPSGSTAASYQVARKVQDLWATHNVVYINYDPVNNRYRAHCVSVGNSAVLKHILSCDLYNQQGEQASGQGLGAS